MTTTKLTPEFKDYFNFIRSCKTVDLEGQLSIHQIKDMRERIEYFLKTIHPSELDEYLQRASATSDTEVQCVLYSILDLDVRDNTSMYSPSMKSVLIKYKPELMCIKEYNKPTKK